MRDGLTLRRSPIGLVPDGPEEDGWKIWGLSGGLAEYCLYAAPRLSVRRRAFGLAYRVYRSLEYVPPNDEGVLKTPFDEDPATLVLYMEDLQGERAGTVSLYYDGPKGLPCDELYGDELDELRRRGRRPVEVTRLAVSELHRRNPVVLARLFNFIFLHAYVVRRQTDFVIEVNPRHVRYYEKTLCFQPIGPERPCPRVGGAPAVLMRLDLDIPHHEVARIGGLYLHNPHHAERLLYANFYPPPIEPEIVRYFERHAP
jgi:hypothetical protein